MNELEEFGSSMDDVDDSDVLSVSQLQGRSWDRDDIPQRLDDIRQAHNNIETNLQDLQSDFEETKGIEELKDDKEGFFENVPRDMSGDPKYYPVEIIEELKKREDIKHRMAVWHARSKELNRFARKVVGGKYRQLLEEYRTAQTYDKLESVLENKAQHYAEKEVKALEGKMQSNIQQLEKLLQVLREQEKNHLEINKELASQASGIDSDDVESSLDEMREFLEEFVDEKGTVVLDSDDLEMAEKLEEREEARDSAVQDQVEDAFDDGDVDVSVRDEIVEDWGDLQTMSLEDIADLYEVDESLVKAVIEEENLEHAGE